ncbi:30008_t:CDS:2, partial [Racocetra persica]
ILDDGTRQTLMFSATFPKSIRNLARDFLANQYVFLTVGRVGGTTSDITQKIMYVEDHKKRDSLVALLLKQPPSRTLVFVKSKRGADSLDDFLYSQNFPTTSIHGDRTQHEREDALISFKNGRCPILIATAVAARGLDIKNVMHVINYDLCDDIDEYVHRIGRTARVGNQGLATTFYNDGDSAIAGELVRILVECNNQGPKQWDNNDQGQWNNNNQRPWDNSNQQSWGNQQQDSTWGDNQNQLLKPQSQTTSSTVASNDNWSNPPTAQPTYQYPSMPHTQSNQCQYATPTYNQPIPSQPPNVGPPVVNLPKNNQFNQPTQPSFAPPSQQQNFGASYNNPASNGPEQNDYYNNNNTSFGNDTNRFGDPNNNNDDGSPSRPRSKSPKQQRNQRRTRNNGNWQQDDNIGNRNANQTSSD